MEDNQFCPTSEGVYQIFKENQADESYTKKRCENCHSDFLPIYKPEDDKDDPQSLLKILEKMLVYDKPVLSKAMFNSIFSSVTSNDT